MNTIEVTRVEFNSREAQDEYQEQMRFSHIPKSYMSYQDVFDVALKIQEKFKASFRLIACDVDYDENGSFSGYRNTTTMFFRK